MATTPSSKEETLALISTKAQTSGQDRFKVVVKRRPVNGQLPVQVAGFDGATFAMIAEPASWLPPVLGGGEYYLSVFHSVDQPGLQLGSPLVETYEAREGSPAGLSKATPSLRVMNAPGWCGPPVLFFPNKDLIMADQLGPHPFAPQAGTPKPNLGQLVAGEGLPQQQQYDPSVQGLLAQAVAKDQEAARKIEEAARREREMNDRETRIAKEQAERDAAIKRQETESKLRDEMRAQNADLKNKLASIMTTMQRPVEAPKSVTVPEIMAAVGPLLQTFITSNNEFRMFMAKQEAENARAARESNERLAQAQREATEKAAAAQMEVLKALSAKPGMSDEMKMLIETLKDEKKNGSVDAMATMMTRMVDSVGVVSKMSIGMIETIANTMGGDPEDPVVTAIKEGVKAMQMLTQGTQAGAQRLIPGAQQRAAQQQARPPAPQQPRPPAQARPPAPQPVQPQQVAQAPAGATATGPQQPPPPVAVPAPNFAEAPLPEVPVAPVQSQADLVEHAIRGKQDADQVAQIIATLIAQKEPSFIAELSKNEGNPSALLGARLGEKWVNENMVYLKELGDAFDRHGEAMGIFDGDETIPENEPEPAPEAPPEVISEPAPVS